MRAIVILPFLAAAGLGVWLLSRGGHAPVTPIEEPAGPGDPSPRAAPPPVMTAPAAAMGGDLAAATPDARPARPGRSSGEGEIKYGAVTVTVVAPEGVAVPKTLSLDVEPLAFVHPQKPLPREQEDGTYRYDLLPSGRWRVRAVAPGFVDATKEVDVRPRGESRVSIPLEPGGSASWKVVVASGAAPELVQVALLDGRGVPIEGTYRTTVTTIHAAPGKVPLLPAEGIVVGLKPGPYRLRVATENSVPAERPFVVTAGGTAALEFDFLR